jgi:hypothetical protein
MASTASLNNKPLQLDGTSGHGQGAGSGSGAGIWLANNDENRPERPAGRSYHISAQDSRPVSLTSNDVFTKMGSSESGDVDLDLSFDFVSQLESNRHQVETPVHNIIITDTSEPPSPRGMATAKWTSRLRKQPPSALRISQKKQQDLAANQPSPLEFKVDGEAPLLVNTLGSTRRANDSGIQSEQIQPMSRAELIIKQRLAAQALNKEQQVSPKKLSPIKKSALNGTPKRTVLGEIKNKSNVQLIPSVEHGDVFDDASYSYKKDLKTSASHVSSNWVGTQSTSFATAHESEGALSGSANHGNSLGLDFKIEAKKDEVAQLNDTANSSPDTPFSATFESDTTRSVSDGVNTPGTAFSTLFDDQRRGSAGDIKTETSAQMKRGLSAPLAATTPLVNDVIKEEESSTLKPPHSTSTDSFLVDLSLMNGVSEDLRDRQGPVSSVSDFGSSPFKSNQPMIVSTADSPTCEVEFLFQRPNEEASKRTSVAKAGPWRQSPHLLNNTSATDLNAGLGIDMGGKLGDHLELDMSELSVERAIMPMMDENTLGIDMGMHDPHSKEGAGLTAPDQVVPSASFVSSVEGYAINITPATKEALQDMGISTPRAARVETQEQSKSKWSNKLWNLSPLASLRSPNKVARKTRSPPMKQLTLRVDNADDGGYNSMPTSAVLPTFAPLQAPSQALSIRARSSRHVSRSSRLRYVPNEDGHVQVDMTSPELNRISKSAVVDARSQFPATSSMTPKMEYQNSAKVRRHSWGYGSSVGHTSIMSASRHLEVPEARESHLFTTMRNSTLSAVLPVEGNSFAHSPMQTVVEDGMRRRINHRATNSVPTTPIVIPASWATPELYETYEQDAYEGVQFFDEDAHARQSRQRRRRTGAVASTIGIHGPASAVGPFFLGLTGTRNRSKMVKTTNAKHGSYYSTRRHTQIQIFSDDREQVEGLIAISGRALETSPSKSLFFAGFLAMPWLWFIGGWGLENDGTVYIDRDTTPYLHHGNVSARRAELAERDIDETMATHVSGRDDTQYQKRNSLLSVRRESRYAMGTPESIIDMEEQYQDFQRRGKAQSWIEPSTHMQDDDGDMLRPQARKTHSLLIGEERNSMQPISRQELREMANSMIIPFDQPEDEGRLHSIDIQDNQLQQEGFAYSDEVEKDSFSIHHDPNLAMQLQGAFAMPMSAWDDDYDDNKKKQSTKQGFFKQVMSANAIMIQHLRKSPQRLMAASTNSSFSLANIEQRRKAAIRAQNQSSPDHQPMLIRAFTNWTRLETFVLWNRIMAMIVSIAVFGAMGVAIFFVVTDW